MLILTGTLRQFGDIQFGDSGEKFLKLWVEHETPRKDGPADLKIEELLIPRADVGPEASNLKAGQSVSVEVRAWASGRSLAFAAVRLLRSALSPSGGSEAK